MKVIELDHATLVVGDRRILVDTSFAIEQGEFIGLLGPNSRATASLDRREAPAPPAPMLSACGSWQTSPAVPRGAELLC